MAVEKKIDCVLLGLLSHEDLTGYEIKKRMDTSLKYFWGASYGSIYPALSDLVERGLALRQDAAVNKRNKIRYSITAAGRAYLREWLKMPVERDELRYETLLKVFFGNEGGASCAAAHISAFQEKTERELSDLTRAADTLRNAPEEDDTHRYYLLTVEFGIRAYHAFLEWCEEAKTVLDRKEG